MICYAIYSTPLGPLRVGYDGELVVSLDFSGKESEENLPSPLCDLVFKQISEYLAGTRKNFDFPYELRGSDFQLAVWRELTRIPYGETRSYAQIASALGRPGASRAVGGANNRNPLLIVIPCHRVRGADGGLVGYAGGLELKRKLLDIERANREITEA